MRFGVAQTETARLAAQGWSGHFAGVARLRTLLLAALAAPLAACATLPDAAIEARWSVSGEPLLLRSEPRFAGAISSLRFRGVEHLDASDHGRLLQGAISFEGEGECLNPTLAGASSDRRRGSSRLEAASAGPTTYATLTRMAYWLRPGQTCTRPNGQRRPAVNKTRLSDVAYAQRLTPGWRGQANAVHHAITITTAVPRRYAVVEALTAYTPPGFSSVLLYDPAADRLEPDPHALANPGEQARPVVLATPDGSSALAFFSPDPNARYGRFLFPDTSKINVVFRPPSAYAPGSHAYEVVTVIGTADEVRATLRALAPAPPPSLASRLRGLWAELRDWLRPG